MALPPLKSVSGALMLALALTACEQTATSPEADLTPQFARSDAREGPTVSPFAGIAAFVDDVNAQLAASGQTLRLDYPWFYQVGPGTDPFARLRTGSRWTTYQPTYVLDESDLDVWSLPAAAVEEALVSAFDTWNDVPNSGLNAVRAVEPAGDNYDFLDGIAYDENDNCIPFDFDSPNLIEVTPNGGIVFDPAADIVVGGFAPPAYFQCLGSLGIIAVTWTLSSGDQDGDQYRDRVYVEQFYNPIYPWVNQGAQYPDLPLAYGVDMETIALHEHGHAHGLGHFGGPVNRQPLKFKPDLRVFNPEAVMNAFYIGGEDRTPYPTDEAGLLTMYSRTE